MILREMSSATPLTAIRTGLVVTVTTVWRRSDDRDSKAAWGQANLDSVKEANSRTPLFGLSDMNGDRN